MKNFSISRPDAASMELNVACTMYMMDENPIAIQALVGCASNLLIEYAEKKNIQNFYHDFEKTIRPEKLHEFRTAYKQAQNFVKHADSNPDKKLDFDYRKLEQQLLVACRVYQDITKTIEPPQQAFIFWYYLMHPEVINDDHRQSFIRQAQILEQFNGSKKDYYESIIDHLKTQGLNQKPISDFI